MLVHDRAYKSRVNLEESMSVIMKCNAVLPGMECLCYAVPQ